MLAPDEVRGEDLALQPADGQHPPRSVISPVIATSLRTGMPVRALTMAVAMVMPADGPSLGMAPAGHVDVQGVLLEDLARDAQLGRVGADPGQARPGRLAHHLAELAGEDEVLLALHAGDLDRDDVAADLGHHQARGRADLVLGLQLAVLEARAARGTRSSFLMSTTVLRLRPSATCRATLRMTLAISRSRLRTPASWVYELDELDHRLVGDLRCASASGRGSSSASGPGTACRSRSSPARCSRAAG